MNLCIFSPKARDDLIEIHDFIAQENPIAAANFIDFLEEKCKLLVCSPLMGVERLKYGNSVRSFPVKNYIIFYNPIQNGDEIIHIFHAKRNMRSLFHEEKPPD